MLLLNRVLTVAPGARPPTDVAAGGDHRARDPRPGVPRRAPLAAILWGRDAQSLIPLLGEVPHVASPHPSPLSASRGFFGSRPFSQVNALLEAQGAGPVDWRIRD